MNRVLFRLGVLGSIVLWSFGASATEQVFSPSVLNGDPGTYAGQTVFVRGLLVLAPEAHVLYESKAKHDELARGMDGKIKGFDMRDYLPYCLTIANPELLYRNQARLNGKTVVLKGRFVADYLTGREIDLGACALPTGFEIDVDDFRRRYGGP